MSDYAASLNLTLYKHSQPVYITEPTGNRQTYVPLRLNLNSSNFNFELAREDGLDFRLCERSNGTGTFYMWVAHWDYDSNSATLWFKIPEILAGETKELWAFWGNENDIGISDVNELVDGLEENYSDNLIPTSTGTSSYYIDPGAWNSSGTQAASCFDDDPNTYWWVSNIGSFAWVQWDFGAGTTKQIRRIRLKQWDIKVLQIQGSNDGTNFDNVYSTSFPDMAGGSVPDVADWYSIAFSNSGNYRYYRFLITPWDYSFIITEIELMDISSTTLRKGVFLIADGFDGSSLDTGKWTDNSGSWSVSNSKVYLNTGSYIGNAAGTISTDPPVNWIVEEGIVGIGSPSSTSNPAHMYRFYGGENVLGINYYWDGSTDRRHDFVYDGTYSTYNGVNKGLEIGSYSNNYLAYYEATDKVYQGMRGRDSLPDYEDSWERKVHRNTEVTRFRIYGESDSSANGVAIDWVVVRTYEPDSDLIVDLSNLWVNYDLVNHENLNFYSYTSDITSIDFYHYSDLGGDPYRLSDNIGGSASSVFSTDGSSDECSIVIDFGRPKETLTNKNYLHYDSAHVNYYNAAKLSDLDDDEYDRNYWNCTTTSGWASIRFPTAKKLCCLMLKAVSSDLNGMAKDFKFYGSQSDPRFSGWYDKELVTSGTCQATTLEQPFYFESQMPYRYYILDVLNTHGNNIAIQEWSMYELNTQTGLKSVSQLRLRPVTFQNNEYYFTKEFAFYGSRDNLNWDELIPRKDTPTPFYDYVYGRWSRHTFTNYKGYYLYKLVCYGNWGGADDTIKISEWEMVERSEEANNYRILAGSSNNFNNVWADPFTTIVSGTVYATNDYLSIIENDILIDYREATDIVSDINA